MHRRTFASLAIAVPFAGCTSLLSSGGVETTIGEDERVTFTADEGAELSVSVSVQEIVQPDDEESGDGEESDIERETISFRLDHDEHGVIDAWTVEDSATFDVTVENGGTHAAMVTGGVADVTIE